MRIITRILAGIGLMVVVSALVGVASVWFWTPGTPELPRHMVLQFDFSREVLENHVDDPIAAALGDDRIALRQLVAALDHAAKDPRVEGFVADVSEVTLEMASIEEVRAALARFRAAGKFTLAYADTFGELGPANREYWLASAFDEIWLQPLGLIGLTGPAATLPFLRGALDKIGITPDFMQRYEYKGAADMFMQKESSAPLREDYTRLLGDMDANLVNDIAAARKLKPAQVRALMAEAPISATTAQKGGLVDKVAGRAAALAAAKAKSSPDSELTDISDYLLGATPPEPDAEPTTVDLVYVTGPITRHADGAPSSTASAEKLVPALEKAAQSKAKALILRVNSPGGSVTASESIRQAIEDVRQKGKFVVVSMGDVAASGGYWVATASDRIIADPSTITGSIGVFGGKVAVGELAEKLGISVETLTTGPMSGMWSVMRPFNAAERTRLNAIFDEIYQAFTAHVADSRKLTPEQVDKVARGRVWLGRHAKEVGLVDELGGLREAYAAVRQHLGLPEGAPLRLRLLPEPEPAYTRVIKILRGYILLPDWLQSRLAPLTGPKGQLQYTGPQDIR